MIYSVIRKVQHRPKNLANIFLLLKSGIFKSTNPILIAKQSDSLLFNLNSTKYYLYIGSLSYLEKLYLRRMDDILELADLAEEPDVSEKIESTMDFDEQFSESESASSEQDFDPTITIEKVPYKDNHFKHSFHIDKCYYKCIVGPNGSNLKKLCNETKTIIRVSKRKKHVVIIGSSQKRIIHAKCSIKKLTENSNDKLRYTHFISIPTNADDIKNNFIKFKQDILKDIDLEETGFHEGFFQKPEKLHLTICMLHLLNNSDKQKAIEALNYCKNNIIDPILHKTGPISMEFRGLKCMNNNAAKARILYINVYEETGYLQKMSDAICEYFIDQDYLFAFANLLILGLSRKEYDNVTLHMTVMNTFYLKKKKHVKTKKNFNATSLLKDYENTSLGKINLSSFHLSKLTAKAPDGYFEATSKIEF